MKREGFSLQILCVGMVLALDIGAGAFAQPPSAADAPAAAEPAAAPTDQPRRRERRRDADADQAAPTASAATPTATAATAAPAATAATAEPKLICKNIKPIGSRVARRICGTEEQWAADNGRTSSDAEESMRQIRDRSGVTGGAASGPASLGTPGFGR
jgi:hypothetical protein